MTNERKRSTAVATAIGIVVIVLSLAVILAAELSPMLAARSRFRRQTALLTEAEAIVYLSVSDPLASTEDIFNPGTELRLTGEQAAAFAESLSGLLTPLSYQGRENAIAGNWDLQIRLHREDGNYDFYVRRDGVYIANDKFRFVFGSKTGEQTDFLAKTLALMASLSPADGT